MTDTRSYGPAQDSTRLIQFLDTLHDAWTVEYLFKPDDDGTRFPRIELTREFERTFTVVIDPSFTEGVHAGYEVCRGVPGGDLTPVEASLNFTEALTEAEKLIEHANMMADNDVFTPAEP